MPSVAVGKLGLYYETKGDGSDVLLIMGFGVRATAWVNQVPVLARSHRVTTFDNRGVGLSDNPGGQCDMRQLADDTVGLLDALKIARTHVVGVSMGGMIAQELSLRHPERVLSLSLIATHAGGPIGFLPTLRGTYRFFMAQRRTGAARLRTLCQLLYTPEFLRTVDLKQLYDVLSRDYGELPTKEARRSQLAAIRSHDTRERLHTLAGLPTLIVKPERDLLVRPRNSDYIHSRIPGSRLVALATAGHGVIRQAPDDINRLLLEHFAAVDARDTASASSQSGKAV